MSSQVWGVRKCFSSSLHLKLQTLLIIIIMYSIYKKLYISKQISVCLQRWARVKHRRKHSRAYSSSITDMWYRQLQTCQKPSPHRTVGQQPQWFNCVLEQHTLGLRNVYFLWIKACTKWLIGLWLELLTWLVFHVDPWDACKLKTAGRCWHNKTDEFPKVPSETLYCGT